LRTGLAAAPVLLGLSAGPACAAGAPMALVTADQEAHVAVVSLTRRRVVQRVATLEGPRSIRDAPGGRALVGHADAGAVTLLEGRTVRVRRVLRGFGAPRYTAVHPDGHVAYVSDGGHGELAVIDLRAGRVRRRVPVGDGARHVTLDPAGTTLWVALGSSAAQIDRRRPPRPPSSPASPGASTRRSWPMTSASLLAAGASGLPPATNDASPSTPPAARGRCAS
jgi:hypothetical protein